MTAHAWKGDCPSEEPFGSDGEWSAFWGAPQAPLILAVSPDDGATWPVRWVLAEDDGYALSNNSCDGLNRELS